jgi:hypothetical protein
MDLFTILLPLPPEYWNYKDVSPCLALDKYVNEKLHLI